MVSCCRDCAVTLGRLEHLSVRVVPPPEVKERKVAALLDESKEKEQTKSMRKLMLLLFCGRTYQPTIWNAEE
jgi:hypothetical protein